MVKFRQSLVAALAAALVACPALAQLPAAQDRPLSAAERTRLASLEVRFTRISAERKTSVAALRTIARAMGTRLTTLDPDDLVDAIDARARELGAARQRIGELEGELSSLDSMRLAQAVGPLLTAANVAIDEGRLSDAERNLAEAGEKFAGARTSLQGRADELAAREAEILAQRASVRRTIFDYLGAADLFGKAAEVLPQADRAGRWKQRYAQALALQNRGTEFNDPAALRQAVTILRDRALPLAPAEESAAEWRRTMRSLVYIQAVLLARGQHDADALRTAVADARALAWSVERGADPIAWGQNQRYLALALTVQGEKEIGTRSLAEAADLFGKAGLVTDPDKDLTGWVIVRKNRAAALYALAKRENGPEHLAQAGALTREVLGRLTQAADPETWALTKQNLAVILAAQAEHSPGADGKTRLEEAVRLSREVAAVMTREQRPARWADAQNVLGLHLALLAMRQGPEGEATVEEALRVLAGAAQVHTFEAAPIDYIEVQDSLGLALLEKGRRGSGVADLQAASVAFRESLRGLSAEFDPEHWRESNEHLGDALALLARRSPEAERPARLAEARAAYTEALALARKGFPFSAARIEASLARLGDAPRG
jgi:hypothetical protein